MVKGFDVTNLLSNISEKGTKTKQNYVYGERMTKQMKQNVNSWQIQANGILLQLLFKSEIIKINIKNNDYKNQSFLFS